MRSVVIGIALFMFAGAVIAAQPGPLAVKACQADTMHQAKCGAGPEGEAAFHRGMMPSPGCGPEMMMGPRCCAPMAGQQCGPWCGPNFPRRHHAPAAGLFAGLLVLGLLLYAALNILLTIIVVRDMLRNNRFVGLWIPVLLIAGIPGTALYALLRIADALQCREAKTGA